MIAARVVALLVLALSAAMSSHAQSNDYPPLDAIRIVVESDLEALKKLDSGDWWMDAKNREWSVQRPARPGVLDTTKLVDVLYRVDGKTISCWVVDLSAKRAQRLPRKACGP